MSQENVALAHRAYGAFSSGDQDAFVACMDSDVVFESLVLESEGRTYRGRDGAREYFNSIREVFPNWQAEIVQLREFGDFLVIEARLFGTGEASGLEVEQHVWQASRARNGKVVWWKFFRTEAEALEAVGCGGSSPLPG
jgi:ketosteroid isomerase-like protein